MWSCKLDPASGAVAVKTKRLSPGWLNGNQVQPFADANGWWHSGDAGRLGPAGWNSSAGSMAPSTAVGPRCFQNKLKRPSAALPESRQCWWWGCQIPYGANS